MKMSQAVEQSLVVLIMLAVQQDNAPVKSHILSGRLEVSESYFKKTMRKLRIAGIVTAIASKEGGFKLARPLHQITLLDVYEAIEGEDSFIHSTQLADRIFKGSDELVKSGTKEVLAIIYDAEQAFKQKLADYTIADILSHIGEESIEAIDWRE